MAYKLGELFWKITANTKDFDTGVKKTEKTTKTLGQKFTGLGKTVALGFGVAAVAGIASVSKELIAAASEAEETGNKFAVVFEDVAAEAEAAGDAIKDEFKISDKDTKAFLSQVGDITSGLGATGEEALAAADRITRLGLDIDSFANLSGGAEQAVSALTSLFTGEREAAKALGIVINETNLKKYAEDTGLVYKEMTALEKGFLSLELAEQQSQKAIGDFTRSIDSYANQSRIAEAASEDLKVALGDNLLGAATDLKVALAGTTRALADYVTMANKAKDVRRDLLDGTLDEARSLEDLQAEYALLSSKIALANGQATKAQRAEQIALEALISSYGVQETFLTKKEEAEAAAHRAAVYRIDEERAAELATAEALEKRTALAKEAADIMEARGYANLSLEEQQVMALQSEIDKWAEFRDVEGVQALINDLIRERNEILAAGNVDLETQTGLVLALGSSSSQYYDTAVNNSAMLAEVQDAEEQRVEDLQVKYKQLASAGFGAVTSGISDMAEALVLGEAAWDSFAKIGLNAIAAVLDALAAQLVAQAAVNAASALTTGGLSIGLVAPALGGAIAASAAAGTIRGLAGSFEQGGVIPEVPGVPATGDNMLARVNPGERIVPADEAGGSRVMYATLVLEDGMEIIAKGVVQDYINSGREPVDSERGLR